MNNEKMHNILRIYVATFTGHKHLQLYLGRVETQGAARRRWRCFSPLFSGLDFERAAPLVFFEPLQE